MPDQPEPRTVESGPVELTAVTGAASTPESNEEPAPSVSEPPPPPTNGDSGVSTAGDDDGDFVSLEELQKMNYDDLKQFCKDNQIEIPANVNEAQDLLDWLLVEFGVDA